MRVLFTTMLAIKDADHVVRFTAFALSRRANMPEKEVLDGLKVLSSPDKRRLEKQDYDGRRIEQVDGGWLVLNGQKYRDMLQTERRKAQQAAYQKAYREREKAKKSAKPVTDAEFPPGPPGSDPAYIAMAKDVKGDERIRDQDPPLIAGGTGDF